MTSRAHYFRAKWMLLFIHDELLGQSECPILIFTSGNYTNKLLSLNIYVLKVFPKYSLLILHFLVVMNVQIICRIMINNIAVIEC